MTHIGNIRHILPYDVNDTPYTDISITISTIQLYTGSLSGHTVHHLAGVQYTTVWFSGQNSVFRSQFGSSRT